MLHLIYGCPGSEKGRLTAELISRRLSLGKKVIYLVPERFSVLAERAVTEACSGKNLMDLDVLSFKRLCNRVFREYGGLAYNYAGKGARLLIMMRALREVRDELSVYGKLGVADKGSAETILEAIVSFKRAALSPEDFEKASSACAEDAQLAGKTEDLAKIWRAYDRLLAGRYDDPEEDLDKVCALLTEHPFFADKEVFVDSTGSFTGQELKIISAAIARSPHVTVILDMLPAADDARPIFTKLRRIERQICKAAEDAGVPIDTIAVLDRPVGRSEGLVKLEKLLFSEKTPEQLLENGPELAVYGGVYEECKAIAAHILVDVQAGGRYMDHAVVVRDLAGYRGIIDQVFESNGVPYTMKDRTPLSGRSAGRLILLALDLTTGGFRLEDLIDYMKTGLSGVSEEDCFTLEDYANLWQIEGTGRWLSDECFAMNPSGHIAERTDGDFETLKTVNDIRARLTAPLKQLHEDLLSCKTMKDAAGVLFEYIDNMKLETRLSEDAAAARARGDEREAQLLAQTFSAICAALDELVCAAGDLPFRQEDLPLMLETVFEKRALAGIPEGMDRVLVSDAFSLKAGDVRYLYAAGMNEGVFPLYKSAKGMFTAREAVTLRGLEIDLPGDESRAVFDEQYLCYNVLTAPSTKLYVSCCLKDLRGIPSQPSELYEELCAYAGKTVEQTYSNENDPALLYGRANCLERALTSSADENTAALRALFEGQSGESLENLRRSPLVRTSDVLKGATVERLYGDKPLNLSQTRLESFLNCPFSYTCQYLLSLREKSADSVQQNEVGTLVHSIFQNLIGDCIRDQERFGSLSNGQVKERVHAIMEKLQESAVGPSEQNAEISMILDRIERYTTILAYNLRDEFAQSGFEPVACELAFGGKEDGSVTIAPVPVTDGEGRVLALLYGKADRVDRFRHDGKAYLRIVDYKTGSKEFVPEAVDEGMNAQMLLYLKVLKESRDPALRRALGLAPGEQIEPAGAFYFIAKRSDAADVKNARSEEELRKAINKSIKRSGMLIDDPAVIEAMEHGAAGVFVPLNRSKTPKNAVSAEAFNEKLEGLDGILTTVVERMRAGEATVNPKKEGSTAGQSAFDRSRSGCEYCPMGPVCRSCARCESEEDEHGAE